MALYIRGVRFRFGDFCEMACRRTRENGMAENNKVNVYRNNYLKLTRQSEKEKHELAFLFLVRTAKIREPEREYRFHPKRQWRLDFAWPDLKIGVEIEGGIWRKDKHGNWAGAHSHPANIQRDIEKGNALVLCGWSLLRFSERELKSTEAIQNVKDLMAQKIHDTGPGGVDVSNGKWPVASSGGG